MKKTARTALFRSVRNAFRLAIKAEETQTDSAEIIEQAQEHALSRRKFLENSGKVLLVGSLAPKLLLPNARIRVGQAKPRIVIVGGGIAGLNALHTLKKAGYDATIYEASGRTGGRMFTVPESMGKGTWTEFGGEFIDTDHDDMWALIHEFEKEQHVEWIDYAQDSELALNQEAFFFDGKHYSLKEAVDAFRTFAPRIKADMEKLPEDINYETKDPFAIKLDKMSLSKYLKKIGASGWIKRLIEVSYESEYGLSPKVQSSLNLTLLISTETDKGKIEFFGDSDERYKIKGGNQRIPDILAKKYAAHIQINRSLESIRQVGNTYNLHFSGMTSDVEADYVIMTVPFTVLRNLELKIEMPPLKRKVINELGYGTNAKLMIGMKSHFWRKSGYAGLVYSDNGINNGWDNAQLQNKPDEAAGLSILFGGPGGVKVGEGTPEFQKDIFLPKWNQIYPGATQQYSGKVARMHWPSYKFNLGSYICPIKGQYTSIIGAEAMPLGNLYFAGEHCGGAFAGFMNGAAKSGKEAAEAILGRLK